MQKLFKGRGVSCRKKGDIYLQPKWVLYPKMDLDPLLGTIALAGVTESTIVPAEGSSEDRATSRHSQPLHTSLHSLQLHTRMLRLGEMLADDSYTS